MRMHHSPMGTRPALPDPTEVRPFATPRDDLVAWICGVWMVVGLFLDGWAHRHQKPETFFTPWHGVLYSGFTAAAVWMLYVVRHHQRPGVSIRKTIPIGYGFRTIGVLIFGLGAIADLLWHELLGIEQNIEALLSPTHITLLTGGLLMAIGPIVSTFAREDARPEGQQPRWGSTGPIVGAIVFIVAVLQFFLMYVSPYNRGTYTRGAIRSAGTYGGGWLQEELQIEGIAAIFLFTFITVCALLYLVRRVAIPRGAFAVLFITPAVLQTLLTSFHTAPRLLGVIGAAGLAEFTWPMVSRRRRLHTVLPLWVFALVTLTWFGLFLGIYAGESPLGWTAPLWAGVPIFAGLLAALLSAATESAGSQPPTYAGKI